ncbi:MAG TPA: hypothetical protein VIE43_17310 [Thermoanaerobaculia bacterium]|jgi:hypothetical protein|nr:hypothetical protein [Thermoanaerobaculia bacterium]
MRNRWILATSILLLMLVPGALHAAGQAPAMAPATAIVPVVAATPAQPVNAPPVLDRTLPDPSFMQAPQEESLTPLFLVAPCTGCTGTACTRLHSCVLNHCC